MRLGRLFLSPLEKIVKSMQEEQTVIAFDKVQYAKHWFVNQYGDKTMWKHQSVGDETVYGKPIPVEYAAYHPELPGDAGPEVRPGLVSGPDRRRPRDLRRAPRLQRAAGALAMGSRARVDP